MTIRFALLPRIFFALLPVCFHGCALPLGPNASATRDHAFISYWPAEGDSGKLRLAVKDIIDLKGEVTTAGSQYLAKNRHRPNATRSSWDRPGARGADRRQDQSHRVRPGGDRSE